MFLSKPAFRGELFGVFLAVILFSLCSSPVLAQDESEAPEASSKKSVDEIARELSNPVGSTASLVFQGTWAKWGGDLPGADEQSSSALIFLPTLPFKLGSGNLTVRPSFPFAGAPVLNTDGTWDKDQGFGDMVVLALWGRAEKSGFLWGFGPTAIFPTASKETLGADQWQLGPAALAGLLLKKGVFGVLWQHWWGLNDPEFGEKVNKGTLQIFYWLSLSGGWQVGGSPVTTANYVTASDIDFTVPLNFGAAKTLMAGNTPIKATLQAQYFVTRPESLGPSWGIFFQISPVVGVPW